MDRSETIVAVSSPPGRAARGLIRLSGDHAFAVVDRLVRGLDDAPPRTLSAVRLRSPDLPVWLTRFRGPQSYTGQDTAELQLPGHPALLERVLRRSFDAGARLAEPGEFTFRAYLAGKLDLTQAEGISATIAAVSDGQLAAAEQLRGGALSRFAAARVERLGGLLALVEAGIDFVDQEDVVPIPPRDLAAGLAAELQELEQLMQHRRSWGAVEALPRVVLVGPPSAGKSTLFNALLGRARAVVDEAPGTTRDVLEEPLRLSTEHGPAEVMLQDLAGLDHAAALLDRDIQSVAQHAIAGADLILHLAPPGHTLRDMAAGKPVLRAVPKADLDRSPSGEAAGLLAVSGVTGQGLDALKTQLAQRLGDRAVSLAGDRLALQPRHEAALRDANRGVRAALDGIDPDATSLDSPECVAGELRMALDALAGLGGELTPDDVIGRVFATFCVGK